MKPNEEPAPGAVDPVLDSCQASREVSILLRNWPKDQPFRAREVLDQHPEWKDFKPLVMDLVGEQLARQSQNGTAVDVEGLLRDFPSHAASIHRALHFDGALQSFIAETQSQPIEWPAPDAKVLDFQLEAVLGNGAFSRVYLAKDLRLAERMVVVKLSPTADHESVILSRLEHPHIVPVIEARSAAGLPYAAVSMPYRGRHTLADVLDVVFQHGIGQPAMSRVRSTLIYPENGRTQRSAQPIDEQHYVDFVARLALEIADALQAAHLTGVIHRDLKPSNVLLSSAGSAQLLDFNLSAHTGEEEVALDGGTLPYMPPERLLRLMDRAKHPATPAQTKEDVFSFGVLLYQLLTRTLPFGDPQRNLDAAANARNLHARQLAGNKNLLQPLSQIDRRLTRLVEGCLSLTPTRRPDSFAQVIQELHAVTGIPARFGRALHRHRKRVATTAAAGLLLACGTTAVVAGLTPAPGSQARADALKAFTHRQYTVARDHWSQVIEVRPDSAEAWFGRGRARQGAGQCQQALSDLYESLSLQPSGRTFAAISDALYLTDAGTAQIGDALKKALAAGYRSPGLSNNLGAFYLELDHYDEAEKHLKDALRSANPEVQEAARTNLARVAYRRIAVRPYPPGWEKDSRQITANWRSRGELLQGALLQSLFAKTTSSPEEKKRVVQECVRFLERAVVVGATAADLDQLEDLLPALTSEPGFQRLRKTHPRSAAPPQPRTWRETRFNTRWVDPLIETAADHSLRPLPEASI